MRPSSRWLASFLFVTLMTAPLAAWATDVDGTNDCTKLPIDFGDAPEGVFAYPGITGKFPTCLNPGPIGTKDSVCLGISTFPGPAGYVRHIHVAGEPQYWMGCGPNQSGIDSEQDGKVNDTGGPTSSCSTTGLGIDCTETTFGMTFGQDECYGSTDAGVAAAVSFTPCSPGAVTFAVFNCGTTPRVVVLNILVDWNQDGDWNDNVPCSGTPSGCTYEWAVKNVQITIGPGCTSITSPSFIAGNAAGFGWMRISLSNQPVNDDFPWAGSATMPGAFLANGESEDYPVTIGTPPPQCPGYEDWGDAPEGVQAYGTGVIGHFPTCLFGSAPGTRDTACTTISTAPGITGYVRHTSSATDPFHFWLGCGNTALLTNGVDGEPNGKMNATGAPNSICATPVLIDCVESAFGLNFGQDECYGDAAGDAGLAVPDSFLICTSSTVRFKAFNCEPDPVGAYLNVLIDWNADGDWNDNFLCSPLGGPCSYEWAVKNAPVVMIPGCHTMTSPAFLAGPNPGEGWMRITITPSPVPDDFPWAGSAGLAGGTFRGGETEDYPVVIGVPADTCDVGYRDFGDAPEGFQAYSGGVIGHFPTCLAPLAAGNQQIECGAAMSSPPVATAGTGYVMHVANPADPQHFWLGCGVDNETDGKTNLGGPAGSPSFCASAVLVDCADGFGGTLFGQDECYGDAEAALTAPISSEVCTLLTIPYRATHCENSPLEVYLNVLVDWNRDGDWNDNVICKEDQCAFEWPIKNRLVQLAPGCNFYQMPPIVTGPYVGPVWMRMSLSANPAPDDFPWNGTAGIGPNPWFNGGETEDYVILLKPENVDVGTGGGSGLWFAPVVPNPASHSATMSYSLPRDADVSLDVYDLAGRRVVELARGRTSAGQHQASWNFRDASGRDVPVGYYVIKLRVGETTLSRGVIRVK